MKSLKLQMILLILLGTVAMGVGCGGSSPPPASSDDQTETKNSQNTTTHVHADGTVHEGPAHGDDSHTGHAPGPHDGTLADWGGGKYHVEFTVDHDKQEATVFILGDDEKTPSPIATDEIQLTIKEPAFQVTLTAAPLEGDAEGTASRFVGTHENLGIVREYTGTIVGKVGDTPYAGDFEEVPHGHEH